MNKTGPAFSDFVTKDNRNRRRKFSIFAVDWLVRVVPAFLLCGIFMLLFMRLFYLQVVRADYYKNLSDNNRTRSKIIPAERGILFDRKNRPLVRNVPSYRALEEKDKKTQWIEKEKALELLAANKGDNIIFDVQREYLYKDLFSHSLGYTGQISEEEILMKEYVEYPRTAFIGKSGLEKEYEIMLKGQDGKELYEVDAHGKIVRKLGSQEALSGQDVKTTLDIDIQKAVHEALTEKEKASVVVVDPRDGGIISLYSKPVFDPNLFTHSSNYSPVGAYKSVEDILTDTENQPFLNRAIGGAYPPGSTFKLVSAIAGLDSGKITEDTEYEDTGVIRVGEFSYSNWYFTQFGKKDDQVNVVKALKRSNDIFFYKAAEATGVEKLSKTAKEFGLGDRTGIDIDGEVKGIVPDSEWKKKVVGESWYLGDTYQYGIGQGFLLTTPLQIAMMTSVFANDGTLYKPHLLFGKKEVLRQGFAKREHIELVREGMKQVCETGGTAWPFFDFKVKSSKLKVDNLDFIKSSSDGADMVRIPVGCKTGTAETFEDKDPHAWITLFAPYYNPEVVVTVLIEHGGEGSTDAGPIAKKILEAYFEKKEE